MRSIKREKQVEFTAEQMFNLVNDIESYPQYLPWCSAAKILSRDIDEIKATIEINAAGVHKTFTTSNRIQKNKMIEIRLVDGPFHHLEGFWLFEPCENDQCNIRFDLEFEFGGGLLSFAFDPIFYQVTNTMMDAFHERAKEVY